MALYVVLTEKRGEGRACGSIPVYPQICGSKERAFFRIRKIADIPVRADICRVISHQVPSGTKSPPVVFVGFLLAHLRITALAVFFFSDFFFSSGTAASNAVTWCGSSAIPSFLKVSLIIFAPALPCAFPESWQYCHSGCYCQKFPLFTPDSMG